jgi:hypothetical protein
MDGLLLLAFVLPGLVAFNLTLSVLSFFFSLIITFGPSISQVLLENSIFIQYSYHSLTNKYPSLSYLTYWIPQSWINSSSSLFLSVLNNPTSTTSSSSLFPQLAVSCITAWTVLSTYGVGGAIRYGKRGWRFVQPCAGGPRFVLLQFCTWTTTGVALVLPWTTVKDLGWLIFLDKVERNDTQSNNAMLVAGAALGMLSNSLCVLTLLSFQSSTPNVTFHSLDQNLRMLETSKIKSRAFFGSDSTIWWWLFLILQGALVIFSLQLAFMIETNPLRNKLIEATLLMVVTALTAVPTAITNAIGGKWKYGEKRYRLMMPFQGGIKFISLQALGWSAYALATITTLTKLYEITFGRAPWGAATASFHQRTNAPLAVAAMSGVFAYICIFASLFFFESNDGGGGDDGSENSDSEDVLDEDDEDDESTALEIAGVLGKRRGKEAGTLDYLIQWKRAIPVPDQSAMKPTWMNERNLSNEALRLCEQLCPTPKSVRRAAAAAAAASSVTGNGSHHHSSSTHHHHHTSNNNNTTNNKGRSTSPPLIRPHQQHQISPNKSTSNAHNLSLSNHPTSSIQSSPRGSVTSTDDWEELEDENGNAYFFNPRTGATRKDVYSPVPSM